MARARKHQGSAEVTAAGVLPNSALVLQHQRALSGPAERETIVGVSMPLGINGRRSLLGDAAASRREQAYSDAHATLFESALAFREAYVTALVDQARAKVLEDQQVALDASTRAVEALAKGGEAAGHDLLRQRVQSRLHRASVESAKALAQASRVLLEAWTEREVALPALDLAVLGNASVAPLASDVPTARVRSLEAASRASELEVRAAQRRWLPDLEFFAGYRGLTGEADSAHGLSLSLTVPLTFFDHGQGDAARAAADAELMRASAERLRRQQGAEARAARARFEQLASGAAELGEARREGRELLAQAQRLYAAGETSITELSEAFRVAEQASLAEIDRISEIAEARLLVMRASGTLLDSSLDRACESGEHRKP